MNELITYIEQWKVRERSMNYAYIKDLLLAIPNDMERIFAIHYVEIELKIGLNYRPLLASILDKLREEILNATKTNQSS